MVKHCALTKVYNPSTSSFLFFLLFFLQVVWDPTRHMSTCATTSHVDENSCGV